MFSFVLDLKNQIKNNITIIQNTGYLTIIECVRLIMPFVALPYIIHIIGTERYGMIVFSQAIISYFSIFINFGLDVSSVKEVALLKSNKRELNILVNSVIFIKLLLLLLSFIVLILSIVFIPLMNEYKSLLLFSFLSCLSELLFPIWYFQGIEKMKYITLVSSSSIILYTLSVFIFVHNNSDYIFIPLLQSICSIITGLVAFIYLLKYEDIKICLPPLQHIIAVLRNAVPFFFSRVSIVFNANMAKTVSGLFLSMESVAAFDIAQKISQFVIIPVQMLNRATYPYVSRTRNKIFITKYLYFSITVGLLLSTVLFLVAPFLVSFFMNENTSEATSVLHVLCLFTFSDTITLCLGTCTLVAFGFSKPFNESVIYSSLFLIILYIFIYLLNLFDTTSFALAISLTSIFVLAYRLYFCIKYNIFQFRFYDHNCP